ncbi:MAG: hypothetical protein F9K29_12745 [Hyphomicrobiaceae bacterium]|nr:MAG: hypothetical protein F9K29_12745 [Hyphomicrobiaceae bacterium]
MSALVTHLENIFAIDWASLGVIAGFCAIAAWFIKEYLAHPPLIIFVYPFMVFFGMVAHYLFIFSEAYPTKQIDQWLMWTIMASICGTILGILFMGCLAAARESLGTRPPRSVR